MTDLTIQTARWCASNSEWQTTIGSTYRVTYSRANPGPYAVNWACNCKAFKYHNKGAAIPTCKHIEAAKARHCKHGWEAAAGSPSPMGDRCPECGGATEVISYGA